ncbi:Os08g0119450 [Oryza sativa Japonica Group]|uniref:Os08g0119450 protein n=1 Tax=Oryza sativa subsp. japonica TaxID=39947 RepID=A0A0P0XB23_ORYSJ|nr:Os08g0119450 [Oryza sativa Japonica Group]
MQRRGKTERSDADDGRAAGGRVGCGRAWGHGQAWRRPRRMRPGAGAAALDAAGLQLFLLGFWLLESVQARKNSMAVLGASWAGH